MKRIIALCVAAIFLLLAGCGDKEVPSSVISGTSSIVSISSEQETTSSEGMSTYSGTWSEDDIGWVYGGVILDIDVDNKNMNISCSRTQSAPSSRVAEFTESIALSEIKNNTAIVKFSNDGWGNSGTLELTFTSDYILADFKEITMDNLAQWGFQEQTFKLKKNADAHNLMKYDMADYEALYPEEEEVEEEEEPAPVYDTSKASGILAQAGLTEQEFRDICVPLRGDKSPSLTKVTNYDISYGEKYYQENPDDKKLKDEIAYYKEHSKDPDYFDYYLKDGLPFDTLDGYIAYRVYSQKGAEIITNETSETLEKMQEYPNDYLGKPYAIISSFYHNYTSETRFGIPNIYIKVADLRDDPHNPNIMSGTNYIYYVIFSGTYVTHTGSIGLNFNLISLEKISK